jgi:hypothetical protein
MEKLNLLAEKYSKNIAQFNPNIPTIKNVLARNIGQCHINNTLGKNPTMNKVSYLLAFRKQMIFACKEIVRKDLLKDEKNFIKMIDFYIHGRPCMENLIEALTQYAFGEVHWKGVNHLYNVTINNNRTKLRNQTIPIFMANHFQSIRKEGNTTAYTKNRLWNALKNKPIYVVTPNGPAYAAMKNIPKGRNLSNEAFNLYAGNL